MVFGLYIEFLNLPMIGIKVIQFWYEFVSMLGQAFLAW